MSKSKQQLAEKQRTPDTPQDAQEDSTAEHDLVVPGLWPMTLEQALRIAASAPPLPQPEPTPPKKPKSR
jgi:hypothetical protein